jgi:hypothetical protein
LFVCLCREPLANLAQCQVLVDRLDAELAARPQQAFHSPRRRKGGKREEEEKAPSSRPIQPLASKGKGKQQPAAAEAASGSKRAKQAEAEAEPSKKRAKKEQPAAAAAATAAGQEEEEEGAEEGSEELSEDEWEITKITVRHSHQFWEKKKVSMSACSHVAICLVS